jgi:tetratricopeptide (TPR) repeat protein
LKRRALTWRRDGIAASIAGDHERAAFFLKGYLTRFPWDTEALKYYVSSRELAELPNGQHFAETIAALKVLVGQDPNSADGLNYRRHLLELYVKLERSPEALDTGKAILAKVPNDIRALELMTGVLTNLHQFSDALKMADNWVRAVPKNLHAHMARLLLRAELSQTPESIVTEAEKLLEANPKDPKFELLRGYAYALVKDREQAIEWFRVAAKQPDLEDDVVKILAAQFDFLAMAEDSLAVIQAAVKGGAGGELRHMLARRLWQMSRWEPLAEVLGDLNLADPRSDATLIAFKCMALGELGKQPESAACSAALSNRKDAAARAWTLLLRRAAGKAVDDRQIVRECHAALSNESDNTYLRHFLGEAYARLGEQDLAAQSWLRAAIQNPIWGVPAVRLVDSLIERGRHAQAYDFALEASQRNPHNAAVVISYARAWAAGIETGNATHADDLLKLVANIQEQLPGEEKTFLIQLQLLARKGSKPEAIKLARGFLAVQMPPPAERVLLAVAGISQQFGLGVENECFAASERIYGTTTQLAYVKASGRLVTGGADQGLKLFDEVAKKSGHADDLPWQLTRVRFMDATKHPAAGVAWIALGDSHPDDLVVQQAATTARSVHGDWDFMSRTIDRLHKLTGDNGLAWRMARAHLLIDSARTDADYEQGSVLLNDIIVVYPKLPEAHALLATALVHLKRMDGAIKHMSEAATLDERSVPISLQLAALLQSRGDFERVRQELDRITPRLHGTEQRQQAALLLARQGSQDRAIQILQETKDQAGNPEEGLLLAVLYNRRGEFPKAEAIVQKLLDQKPDLATIQFAASMYASKGRRDDARRVLARMDALKLELGVKELVWASYFSQQGDLTEAANHYSAAAKEAPANPIAWRALITCQMALGKSADAQQTLADGLRSTSGDKDLVAIREQLELLRQSMLDDDLRPVALSFMHDPANGAISLELLGIVTEARRTKDMSHLASKLQQMSEQHPTSLAIQLQLVRCLLEMQSIGPAITLAQRAINTFPEEEEAARIATRLCALDRRWDQMLDAAQIWRKRAVMDAVAADVGIAQAQIKSNAFDAALAQLQPDLSSAVAEPNRNPDVLMAAAIAMAGAGKIDDATNFLWPLAKKEAIWRNRWIEAGVEFSDSKRAVAWLDQVAEIIPADAIDERVILAEGYEHLGRQFKNQNLIQKASDLFAQITADPKVTALALLAAGAEAERCEAPVRAAEFYRRAIAMDANLWVAKNNLAMLLIRNGGDPKQATAMAQDAVRLQPQRSEVHDTLAAAEAKDGQPRQAAETIRTALLLEPNNVRWHVGLAKYLLASGDVVEAKKAITMLDSGHLEGRGLPPEIKKELDDVRRDLNKALKSH